MRLRQHTVRLVRKHPSPAFFAALQVAMGVLMQRSGNPTPVSMLEHNLTRGYHLKMSACDDVGQRHISSASCRRLADRLHQLDTRHEAGSAHAGSAAKRPRTPGNSYRMTPARRVLRGAEIGFPRTCGPTQRRQPAANRPAKKQIDQEYFCRLVFHPSAGDHGWRKVRRSNECKQYIGHNRTHLTPRPESCDERF